VISIGVPSFCGGKVIVGTDQFAAILANAVHVNRQSMFGAIRPLAGQVAVGHLLCRVHNNAIDTRLSPRDSDIIEPHRAHRLSRKLAIKCGSDESGSGGTPAAMTARELVVGADPPVHAADGEQQGGWNRELHRNWQAQYGIISSTAHGPKTLANQLLGEHLPTESWS
jgi:hypothetical protein